MIPWKVRTCTGNAPSFLCPWFLLSCASHMFVASPACFCVLKEALCFIPWKDDDGIRSIQEKCLTNKQTRFANGSWTGYNRQILNLTLPEPPWVFYCFIRTVKYMVYCRRENRPWLRLVWAYPQVLRKSFGWFWTRLAMSINATRCVKLCAR